MSERSAMPIRQALRLWAAMALATSPRLRLLRRLVPGVAGRANCPAPTFVSDVERVAEFQATALEMSRKAALAERRAEEAEAETERVLDEIEALIMASTWPKAPPRQTAWGVVSNLRALVARLRGGRVVTEPCECEHCQRTYGRADGQPVGRTLGPDGFTRLDGLDREALRRRVAYNWPFEDDADTDSEQCDIADGVALVAEQIVDAAVRAAVRAEREQVLDEIQALPITCIDGVNYVSRRDIVALRGGGGS